MYLLTVIVLSLIVHEGYFLKLKRVKHQVVFGEEEESTGCNYLNVSPGNCISLDQCGKLRFLVASPTPGNLNILRRVTCGFNTREPLVCCPFADVAIVTDRPVRPNPTSIPNIPNRPPPQRLEERLPSVCGQSSASHTRIVDGEPASRGAWPWIALLGYKDSSSGVVDFGCGGSLITNRHILTAAHCVFGKDDLTVVRLGEHDLLSTSDAEPIDIGISVKTIHERYDSTGKSWQNDIAILTLNRPVAFSEFISPVCLPVAVERRSQNYTNMNPFVAGWGTTEFQGRSSNVLLQTQVLVAPLDQCNKAYARFNSVVVDQRVLCAGARKGREDACQGDSGGPLMLPIGENYYQIGVVSFGFKCAQKEYPGVYTRTGAFIDWIIEKVV